MKLKRYSVVDDYTLEELKSTYLSSSAKERIDLLAKLNEDNVTPPYDIALLAVQDSNATVRQWFARHGKVFKYGDSDLTEYVKSDQDHFVRACLYENSNVYNFFSLLFRDSGYFITANHLERLALVRNPDVSTSLIEKIFDLEDGELGLDMQSRKELFLAYLTNEQAMLNNVRSAALLGNPHPPDGSTWYSANKFLDDIWKLAAKWPEDSFIPAYVYRFVPVSDHTKASVYETVTERYLRCRILEGCDGDYDWNTINLGINDSDVRCRELAAYQAKYLNTDTIDTILQGNDKTILSALANNHSLASDIRGKCFERLRVVDAEAYELLLECGRKVEYLEEINKSAAAIDPNKLFGIEGRKENFLEDKIDFIGKKLSHIEDELIKRITASIMREMFKYVMGTLIISFLLFYFLKK
jgi:hypothetical protein